jgi:predicted enzyme related to lactoylglutathione lyase
LKQYYFVEVPQVGRFAVLIDPTGAALAIITMAEM